jgi:hypothetical protein
LPYAFTFWPLPVVLTAWALPALHGLEDPLHWWAGTFLFVMMLAAILMAQFNSIEPLEMDLVLRRGLPRWFLTLVTAAIAVVLCRQVYATEWSTWTKGILLGAVGMALALEVLRSRAQLGHTWFYASLIGLLLAEVGGSLVFWAVEPLQAALFLFGCFYLMISLIQDEMTGKVSKTAVIAHLSVGLVGLAAFWYWAG